VRPTPGLADERSVDVDERRDPQPDDDSRPPLVAAHTDLTPPQKAWSAYTVHSLACRVCCDVDAGACETAGDLYQAWVKASDDAFRRLAGGAA
jgi:hypothetical protein